MVLPKVYIIILNWNGCTDTLECIKSVEKLTYTNFVTVVVDNASVDNSVDVIRNAYPYIELIVNRDNLGFTGGNNSATRWALKQGADYVWLLNNDTVVEENTLSILVDQAEATEEIAMVSPLIYYFNEPNDKQFVGSYINWSDLSIMYPDRKYLSEEEFRYSGNNICLWGTALLIKRKTIEKIGYLNEKYFAYWEDTEYSMRVLENGLCNKVCSGARIYHKQNRSESNINKGIHYYYFMHRNRIFIGKQYLKGFKNKFTFYRKFISNLIQDIGKGYDQRDIERRQACLNGAWHGFISVSGPMTSEKNIPYILKIMFVIISKSCPYLVSDLLDFNCKKLALSIKKRICSFY